MTHETDNNSNSDTASVTPASDHADERRRLVKKLAAGAFGAPVVLAGLSRKAAAASAPT